MSAPGSIAFSQLAAHTAVFENPSLSILMAFKLPLCMLRVLKEVTSSHDTAKWLKQLKAFTSCLLYHDLAKQ